MISLKEISGWNKRLFLMSIIMTLVLFSWVGTLDQLSYKYLDSSLTSATFSYVSARGINAAVSMFQTVEIGAGVASIQVGQMLDPINDMVERFSNLIVLAIGSIITQKILLSIISSIFFKTVLTISGLLLVVSIYVKENPYIKILTKNFVFIIFIRFVLGIMLLLNFAVDEYFLDSQIKYNQDQVSVLNEGLNSIQNENIENENIEKKNDIIMLRLQENLDKKEALIIDVQVKENARKVLEGNVNRINASIEERENNLSLIDKYNPMNKNDRIDVLKKALDEEVSLVEKKESTIEEVNNSIELIDEKISYDSNALAGKSNGVIDDVFKGASSMVDSYKSIDVSAMKDKLDKKIGSLLDLLILFAMKTLILPILFMYLLLKVFKLVWGINLADFIRREYATLNPTDSPPTIKSK